MERSLSLPLYRFLGTSASQTVCLRTSKYFQNPLQHGFNQHSGWEDHAQRDACPPKFRVGSPSDVIFVCCSLWPRLRRRRADT
jgi:hypothetical protein